MDRSGWSVKVFSWSSDIRRMRWFLSVSALSLRSVNLYKGWFYTSNRRHRNARAALHRPDVHLRNVLRQLVTAPWCLFCLRADELRLSRSIDQVLNLSHVKLLNRWFRPAQTDVLWTFWMRYLQKTEQAYTRESARRCTKFTVVSLKSLCWCAHGIVNIINSKYQ